MLVPLALAATPSAGASRPASLTQAKDGAAARAAQARVAELGSELERDLRGNTGRAADPSVSDAHDVLVQAKQFYGRLRSQPVRSAMAALQPDSSLRPVGAQNDMSRRTSPVILSALQDPEGVPQGPRGEAKNLDGRRDTPTLGNRLLLERALSYRGAPYRWGGASRDGLDCSGLVLRALSDLGRKAPHSAALQFGLGQPVSEGTLQPGDLVFFTNTYKPGISHVGIYQEGPRFIHASSASGRVTVGDLNDRYFRERYAGARRLLALDALADSAVGLGSPRDAVFAPFHLGLP